ncbi:hypothetical protein QCA50_010215 [Cerrena zonata]|uniref:Uncharacterized protein n=1 Tax=Cerrena zonata TaxID=2478898 RepID=A0AAW0G639_9APHY
MSPPPPEPYNFTIQDTSPMWQYMPFADGDMRTGWQWLFPESGVRDRAPRCQQHPKGVSFHTTAAHGANMTLDWLGVGIYLFGSSNSSYRVTVDNNSTTFHGSSNGLLFAQDGMDHQPHTITVTALPKDPTHYFNFDYGILTDVSPEGARKPRLTIHQAKDVTQVGRTPISDWLDTHDHRVSKPFIQTTVAGASASINFTSSVGVSLNGTMNCDHELYTVELADLTNQTTYRQTYNGTSRWFIPDSLLFYRGGLNPLHDYQVTLTNAADSRLSLIYGKTQKVNEVSEKLGPSSSNTPKLTVTLIVVPIIATILVLLIAISLVVYLQRKSKVQEKALVSTTNTSMGTISPYTIPRLIIGSSLLNLNSKTRRLQIENGTNLPNPVIQSAGRNSAQVGPWFDIDRLVELVTQRMARRSPSNSSMRIPSIPPPQYSR